MPCVHGDSGCTFHWNLMGLLLTWVIRGKSMYLIFSVFSSKELCTAVTLYPKGGEEVIL